MINKSQERFVETVSVQEKFIGRGTKNFRKFKTPEHIFTSRELENLL